MPAFTIGRVYEIVQGKNYNPTINDNTALKFRGISIAGSTSISYTESDAIINKIAEIQLANGTAAISGSGIVGRAEILTAGTTSITVDRVMGISGSQDYYLYDISRPSNLDAPIQAIHIISPPGNVTLVTADSDEVILPNGSLVVGGVYDYSLTQLSNLSNAGSIHGLAPSYYI
jgi:hypothetical protein